MNEKLLQNYGPIFDQILDLSELKKYLKFSEKAFLTAQEIIGNEAKDWNTPEGNILTLLNYHALNTSYSVRILNTYVQSLEAFALLRVRLEQLFVCSYLIHSEAKDGFEEFIQDINRSDHRYAKSIENLDPSLFGIIENIFPDKLDHAEKKAFVNERSIDPHFDFENDKLKRKWTNLNTYDMCLHRDKKINQEDPISSIKHQHLYLSIYKSASIFIHSETGILTDNFIQVSNGQIGPQMAYLLTNLVNVALIDIIQCYEVVNFIKPGKTQKMLDLYSDYSSELANDYKVIFER